MNITPSWLQQYLNNHNNSLSFFEFMQQALYNTINGYYNNHLSKFGEHGDFITAPELTSLFGQTLARQCQEILNNIEQASILEFGAGSGKLCIDILLQLEKVNCLPHKYLIIETSGNLRHRQRELINNTIPHLTKCVHWLDTWPTQQFSGIILANEVLDAMPIWRFLYNDQGIYESYIKLSATQQLTETYELSTNQELIDYVKKHVKYKPYMSEVNLLLPGWLKECHQMLASGVMLIIDYGFPRHEYYHPERDNGSLMCHYQHLAHINPLINIGEQDITAHVDFTYIAELANSVGFNLSGYTNQAAFLLNCGLLNISTENTHNITNNQALKKLLQPQEMGELFKVIGLSKNFTLPLLGFSAYDKSTSLFAEIS